MKVLLTHRPGGAYAYISDGWLNALNAAGYDVKRWDGKRSTWDEFDPDLYVGCSGHQQPIPADRGKCLVAIHVNPYCGTNIDGINESPAAIAWTLAQKPAVVFGYGHEADREYWDYWMSRHGIPWAPMPTAGDSTIYYNRCDSPRRLDLVYVGGFWAYKGQNIKKYLLPVLETGHFKQKVCGWGDWPIAVDTISDADVPALLTNAKIGPCIAEPHTAKWGIDVPERIWKVALAGALAIHDPVKGLGRYLSSAIVANDPRDYLLLCERYRGEEDTRAKLALAQQNEVLEKHTYFQRMSTLFATICTAITNMSRAAQFADASAKLATWRG